MLEREGDTVRLTSAGRLLSNEVFQRFLGATNIPTWLAVGADPSRTEVPSRLPVLEMQVGIFVTV